MDYERTLQPKGSPEMAFKALLESLIHMNFVIVELSTERFLVKSQGCQNMQQNLEISQVEVVRHGKQLTLRADLKSTKPMQWLIFTSTIPIAILLPLLSGRGASFQTLWIIFPMLLLPFLIGILLIPARKKTILRVLDTLVTNAEMISILEK